MGYSSEIYPQVGLSGGILEKGILGGILMGILKWDSYSGGILRWNSQVAF